MSNVTAYKKTAITGGGASALDGINGAILLDGDFAFVIASEYLYFYILDDDSAAAESSPSIISPDTNAGNKRWILQSFHPMLIRVGAGSGASTSANPAMLVDRPVSVGAASAHGYADISTISKADAGYNSYDSRVIFTNADLISHYAGFQTLITHNGAGIITNLYGFYHNDPEGAGPVTNQYGFYCALLNEGSAKNYAIYTADVTPSYFGGKVGFGDEAAGDLVSIKGINTGTNTALGTPLGINLWNSSNTVGNYTSIVNRNSGNQANAAIYFKNIDQAYAGQIDFITRSAVGEYGVRASIDKDGNFLANKAITMTEISAPAAPAANGATIYAVDNGAGKTQLMVRFASGAAQQIAIEP